MPQWFPVDSLVLSRTVSTKLGTWYVWRETRCLAQRAASCYALELDLSMCFMPEVLHPRDGNMRDPRIEVIGRAKTSIKLAMGKWVFPESLEALYRTSAPKNLNGFSVVPRSGGIAIMAYRVCVHTHIYIYIYMYMYVHRRTYVCSGTPLPGPSSMPTMCDMSLFMETFTMTLWSQRLRSGM